MRPTTFGRAVQALAGRLAGWRRATFRPRPLSPALEGFVRALAATPYDWQLRADGKLRARDGGVELCAVTGVVRHRRGEVYSVGDWLRAGECIGLSSADAGLIVAAADGRALNAPGRRLRRRLLIAARMVELVGDERGGRRRNPMPQHRAAGDHWRRRPDRRDTAARLDPLTPGPLESR